MKNRNYQKIALATAVSMGLGATTSALAEESSEAIVAAKLSLLGEQLLLNVVYEETEMDIVETYVESALLNHVEELPVECDVQSVFPVEEAEVDNPAMELVASWIGLHTVLHVALHEP